MASSGTFQKEFQPGQIIRGVWSGVQDVLNNRTTVTLEVWYATTSGHSMSLDARYTEVTINGVTQKTRGAALNVSGTAQLLNRYTQVVNHADDGSATLAMKAMYYLNRIVNGTTYTWVSCSSGTIQLDPIARASTLVSASESVPGGGSYALVMARASTKFYHQAEFMIPPQTPGGTILTEGTDAFAEALAYTVPYDWLSCIQDLSGVDVYVTVQTYTDESLETAIGDPVSTKFRMTLPGDARPTVQEGWFTIEPLQTIKAGFDYIQGISRAKLSFDASKVNTKYMASIAGFKITCNGESVTEAPYVTGVLNDAGAVTISCLVTDSRGQTNDPALDTATGTILVSGYTPPTLANAKLLRSENNGAPTDADGDNEGGYIYGIATANYDSAYGAAVMKIGYKLKTETAYGFTALQSGAGAALGGGLLLNTRNYDAIIMLTDGLGNLASYARTISASDVAFNLRDGGKGARFGGYADTDDLLRVDWNAQFDKDVHFLQPGTVRGSLGAADAAHGHALDSEALTGILPLSKGGLGASDAATARQTLGVPIDAVLTAEDSPDAVTKSGFYAYPFGTTYGQLIVSCGSGGQTVFQLRIPPAGAMTYRRGVVQSAGAIWGAWEGDCEFELPYASGFTAYSASGSPPILKVAGNVAALSGIAKPTAAISGSGSPVTICTIPEGYRPAHNAYALCQGTGQYKWLLCVTAEGDVQFSRYSVSNSYATAATTVWLPFHITWIL